MDDDLKDIEKPKPFVPFEEIESQAEELGENEDTPTFSDEEWQAWLDHGNTVDTDFSKAYLNVNLAGSMNPDVEAAVVRTAKKLGLPVPLVRAMDNQEMNKPDLNRMAPETIVFIADSPSNAAIIKGDEKQVNDVVEVAQYAAKPEDERKQLILDSVKEIWYTPKQLSALFAAGYRAKAADLRERNGKFQYNGEEVSWPILPEWYSGPRAVEYYKKQQKARKELLENSDFSEFRQSLAPDIDPVSPTEMSTEALARLADISQYGYTEEQIKDLEALGYRVIDAKKRLLTKDGATFTDMLLPKWYMSPEEADRVTKEAVEASQKKFKNAEKHGYDDKRGSAWLVGAPTETVIGYIDRLKKEIAVMHGLYSLYGDQWVDFDDAALEQAVQTVGKENGLDVSDLSVARFRKAGVGWETDWGKSFDFLGLGSELRDRVTLSKEELVELAMDLSKGDLADLLDLVEYLEEYARGLRGRTGGNAVTEGVLDVIRFSSEIGATGGTSITKAGLDVAKKEGKKGLLRFLGNAFARDAGKAVSAESIRTPRVAEDAAASDIRIAVRDGEVVTDLTEADLSRASEAVFNHLLNAVIERSTESAGGLVPTGKMTKYVSKLVPERVKRAAFVQVAKRVGQNISESKGAKVSRIILDRSGWNGFIGEYWEELLGDTVRLVATELAQAFDTKYGDLGQKGVFGTPEEEVQRMGTLFLGGAVLRLPGVAYTGRDIRNVLVFADTQSAIKDRVDAAATTQRSPETMEKVIRDYTGLNGIAYLTPEDARVLYQSLPEAMEKIRLSEDRIAEAEMKEHLIPVSLAGVAVRLERADFDTVLSKLVVDPKYSLTVEQAENIDLSEEAQKIAEATDKERSERKAAFDEVMDQLHALGRPGYEVRAVAKLLAMADHFGEHSGMTAAEWIRNVALKKLPEEEFQRSISQTSAPDSGKEVKHRGAISFNDAWEATVVLFDGAADASTLIHETSHYAFEMMRHLVESGVADERMQSDFAKLQAWVMGRTNDPVEQKELLAKAFEAYCMEGKAPTIDMNGAFKTLRASLMNVYKGVKTLKVNLTDDVRRVFDGMLASDEKLAQQSFINDVVSQIDKELLGLPQEEAKVYRELIAKANAQSLAELTAEKDRELAKLRPHWRRDANTLMSEDRVYRAWNAIRKEGGMDYVALESICGEDVAKALREKGLTTNPGRKSKEKVDKKTGEVIRPAGYYSAKSGKHPASFAAENGFDSVEQMAEELVKAQSPKAFTEQYMTEREQEFHREFDLSEAALSVEASVEALEKLSDLLGVRAGAALYRTSRAALKANAEADIAEMKVRNILKGKVPESDSDSDSDSEEKELIGSSKRNAQKMTKAINDGDFVTAFDQSKKLRYNLELLQQMAQAKKIITKTEKVLSRARKAKEGSIDGKYKDALMDLSIRFGFTDVVPKHPSPHTVASVIEGVNRERDEAERIELPALLSGGSKHFKDMTFQEFEDLVRISDFLYGEGRDLVSESEQTFRAGVKEAKEGCIGEMAEQKHNKVKHSGLLKFVADIPQWGTKLRNILGEAGQWKEDSMFQKLYDEMAYAESAQYNLSAEPTMVCQTALKELHDSLRKVDFRKLSHIPFPSDVVPYGYKKWDAEKLVMCCLNMGTLKNMQRLKDGFSSEEYKWDETTINTIASMLTEKDWANIQAICGDWLTFVAAVRDILLVDIPVA